MKKIKNTMVNVLAMMAICAGGIASAFEAPREAPRAVHPEAQYEVSLDVVEF